MAHSVVESLVGEIAFIHGSFLGAVEDLDDERFRSRPGSKAPSIAFHLWHTARWPDALQERFGSFAPQLVRFVGREQIWTARQLAGTWGLGDRLGEEATGMGLDDDASAALPLPARDDVVSYARQAFTAAEEVLRGVEDDEFFVWTADFYGEGDWVVIDHFGWHLTHASRHLGMSEALKGVLDVRGTATV